MDVPRRARLRHIEVGVGVDPNNTECLTAAAEKRRGTGDGTGSNRVVSPQNQRKALVFQRLPHPNRQFSTDLTNLGEVHRLFFLGNLLGNPNSHVAGIFHLEPQFLESRLEAAYSDCRRSHVNTTPTGSQVHRHSDDPNRAELPGIRFWLVHWPRLERLALLSELFVGVPFSWVSW